MPVPIGWGGMCKMPAPVGWVGMCEMPAPVGGMEFVKCLLL